ncbi:LysM peptidoglycan-binding domain-containing protein [Weissella confusa]|uniref:LysM peptidoglycan-binding domain-containing protein n=1 Tax=Weissella confusa TaxID=1583 RepID=UPI0022E149BC|nr:LysM peptidoglycan-binding domain-containing protein [Weissella confusa]
MINKQILTAMTTAGVATVAVGVNASADTYTVKAGDTLTSIANAMGTTVEKIASDNNIEDANFILTGVSLTVTPVQADADATVTTTAAPVGVNGSYTVKNGDTLFAIAQANDMTLADLLAINGLTANDTIFIGQTINLVAQTAPVAPVVESAAPVASEAPVASDVSEVAPVAEEASEAPVVAAPASNYVGAPTQADSFTQTTDSGVTTAYQTAETPAPAATGSVYDQFIAAGGTDALWSNIVMPESGGNPDIVSPNGYRGLGQTKQSWGTGSVSEQTAGMVNYAVTRYGSIDNAVSFRVANGWW